MYIFRACLRSIVLGCEVLALPLMASARTWRVPADVPLIQQAVDSAQSGDDILLGPGVYGWTAQGSQPSMIRMKSGILLHSEMGADATSLDGEGRGRLLLCDGTTGVVIEGLTFKNGFASPTNTKVGDVPADHNNRFGGAIWSTVPSSITLRSCVFRNNAVRSEQAADGGAVHCDNGTIEDCIFEDNFAGPGDAGGGAVRILSGVVTRSTFRRNRSLGDFTGSGGAIAARGTTVSDCLFESNSAAAFRNCYGGAVVAAAGAAPNRVERCVFIGNTMRSQDGLGGGGGVAVLSGEVIDCVFVENEAKALFFASASGGGLYSLDGSRVAGCTFLGNRSIRENPPGVGQGSAMLFVDGGRVESCTMVQNLGANTLVMNSGGTATNTIVALNIGAACGGTPGPTWTCSDVWGNTAGDAGCGIDGGSNLNADPLFCAKDPIAARSVEIQKDSPCVPSASGCGLVGAGGVECGSVAVRQRTWSEMKGLYR